MGVARPAITAGDYRVTTLTNSVFKQNCYLVTHEPTQVHLLIDPGMEEPFLTEQLGGVQLGAIALTHGHFDHVASAEILGQRFGITAQIHKFEERLVRQAGTYAYRFARAAVRAPRGLAYYSPETTSLEWGGRSMQVLATPGHTSGSVSYVLDGAFVFTGDTLFHSHIGPTNYPESDLAALKASVAQVLESLPEACIILPGHGRPWTIGEGRAWWRSLTGAAPSYFIFGDTASS